MRDGEVNGVDYFFITSKQFEEYIASNNFIDYKTRNGYYYGILNKNITDNTIFVSGDTKKLKKLQDMPF